MSEEVPAEWECRYVPRDGWLSYLAAGWEIKELAYPHGQYSVLAVRPAPQPERT